MTLGITLSGCQSGTASKQSSKDNASSNKPSVKALNKFSATDRYALIYYGGVKAVDQIKADDETKTFKNAIMASDRSKDTALNVTPMKISKDFVSNPGTGYLMAIAPADVTIIGYVGYTREADNIYYYALIGNDPNRAAFSTVSLKSLYRQYYLPEKQRLQVENLKARLNIKKVNTTFASDSSSSASESESTSTADSSSGETNNDSSGSGIRTSLGQSIFDEGAQPTAKRLFKYIRGTEDPNAKLVSSNAPDPDPLQNGMDDYLLSISVIKDQTATNAKPVTYAVAKNGQIYFQVEGGQTENGVDNYFTDVDGRYGYYFSKDDVRKQLGQ